MKITHVWRTAVLLAISVVVGSGSCSVAMALEPGVHVDPGSPAAKEYALPLGEARQTGQGGGPSPSAGSSGELFGAGISSRPSRSLSASASVRRSSPRRGAERSQQLASTHAAAVRARTALVRQGSSQAGGDSTLALFGGGVLVLVLAAFLGMVLRGRRTTHSS